MAKLIIIIFILIYSFLYIRRNGRDSWRMDVATSRVVKHIHYFGLFVVTIVAVLYWQFGLGLRGLWTTRVFICLMLFTGVFFRFVSARDVVNKVERIYFLLLSFFPVAIGLGLLIPLLGVVLVLSFLGQLTDPADKIYYEDKNLRVQSTFVGVMGPPRIDIFEKKGIFEKHLLRTDFNAYDFDSLKVKYDTDSTRILFSGLPKTDYVPRTISLKKIE